jgi:hypothetical protein
VAGSSFGEEAKGPCSDDNELPKLVAGSPFKEEADEQIPGVDETPELVLGSSIHDDVQEQQNTETYFLYNVKGTPFLTQDIKCGDSKCVASFVVSPDGPFRMLTVTGADMSFITESVRDITFRLTPQESAPFWKHTIQLRQKNSGRVLHVDQLAFGCRETEWCERQFQDERYLRKHIEKCHLKVLDLLDKTAGAVENLVNTIVDNSLSKVDEPVAVLDKTTGPVEALVNAIVGDSLSKIDELVTGKANHTKEKKAENKRFVQKRIEQWQAEVLRTELTKQKTGMRAEDHRLDRALICRTHALTYRSLKYDSKLAK